MKHMKRALSLVLAMVMLLGMMVIPTGAVSNFTDETEITYTEAVEVTSGIGLFAGAAGKFMPKGTVTRAQMATIIVKMLYGSEANADSFKGVNGGFTDTASFDGGWAEGYINWCASLGVVAGYGDGTFKPGEAVTTAEAVTMIINALGIDAGEGQWPYTVMSKADELKFFKGLSPKPDTNEALTREELAVVSLHGLEYCPTDKVSYIYNGRTYDSYMAAAMVAGDDIANIKKAGSLAADVFGLKSATGYITRNQATGLDYTELKAYMDNQWKTYKFDIETDQNAIGHYVTVYYDEQYVNENKPGKTYSIFDEGTVVEVTEDIDSRTDFRAAFGSASVKLSTVEACVIDADYTVKTGYPKATGGFAANDVTFVTGDTYNVPAGTYILDGNTVVAYIAPAIKYASIIEGIERYEGEELVSLRVGSNIVDVPNDEGNDLIDEFVTMKAGDYVTYEKVGPRYVLERVRVVTGKVTSKSTTKVNGDPYDTVTVDGVDYVAFTAQGETVSDRNYTGLSTSVAGLNYTDTYDFYVTRDGKFIGFKVSDGTLNLDNVAYLLGVIPSVKEDSYGDQVITYYARGVDMNGVETLIPVAQVKDANRDGAYTSLEETLGNTEYIEGHADYLNNVDYMGNFIPFDETFYSVKDYPGNTAQDKEARKEGIKKVEAYKTTYNKETSPVFVNAYTMRNLTFGGNGTFNVGWVNKHAGSKYLVMDGTADQSTALTAAVKTGSITITMDASITAADALLSRTEAGAYMVEAMIFRVRSTAATVGGTPIYVAKEKATHSATTGSGYIYDVYNATNGKEMQITLATDKTLKPGFYQVAYNEEYKLHEFVSGVTDAARPSDYEDGWVIATDADARTLKETDTEAAVADGMPDYAACYSTPFTFMSGSNMTAGNISNVNASGVAVVDTRSQAEMDGSKIGAITSVDRMSSLKLAKKDLIIKMDLWFNSSSDTVTAVYITDVVDPATDKRFGSLLVSGADTDSFYVMTTTDADNLPKDGSYTPEKPVEIDCSVTGCNHTMGFFKHMGLNSTKTKVILRHLVPADAAGTFGMHNVVLRTDGDTWVLTDAHAATSDTATIAPCTNGFTCWNNPAAEASMYLDLSYGKVVDLTGEFGGITNDGLKTEITTRLGLADTDKGNELVLSYYCAEGYGDTKPEYVFITGTNGSAWRYPAQTQPAWRLRNGEWALYTMGTADQETLQLKDNTTGTHNARTFMVYDPVNNALVNGTSGAYLHYNEVYGSVADLFGNGLYRAMLNPATGRTTLVYQTPVEITEVSSNAVLLKGVTGAATIAEVKNLLEKQEHKIMGNKVTEDGEDFVYVTSVEESLRQVTLNDGDRITITDPFAANAGYVKATVVESGVPGAYEGWKIMAKFDDAANTVAGDYQVCVSPDSGRISLKLLETEVFDETNKLTAADLAGDNTVTFATDVYPDYKDTDTWKLADHINDNHLVVKAKQITLDGVTTIEIQSVYYEVPEGAVLYMADPNLKNDAKFGPFYVLFAPDGSSLAVGEKYYFAIENTSDARFFTGSDDNISYLPIGVFCYGWKEGEILTSGSTGVRRANSFNADSMLKATEDGFVSLRSNAHQALWYGRLGYHRVANNATMQNNQCILETAFRSGCGSAIHNNIWQCGEAAGGNANKHTSGLILTSDTVIVDARYGSTLTLEEFVSAVNSATTTKLVVDFLSTERYDASTGAGKTIQYLVINDMTPSA